MDLQVAYKISFFNDHWVAYLLLALIIILYFVYKKTKNKWIFTFFCIIPVALIFIFYRQVSHTNKLLSGNYHKVEGIVENFDPMPYEGHKDESFTVKNIRFSYSDYEINGGFNNTLSHGGPIYPKRWVKIYYIDDGLGSDNRIILELFVKPSEDR